MGKEKKTEKGQLDFIMLITTIYDNLNILSFKKVECPISYDRKEFYGSKH